MVIFQIFKKYFLSMSTHFVTFFFMLSPQFITHNKSSLFVQREKKIQIFLNQEFILVGQEE